MSIKTLLNKLEGFKSFVFARESMGIATAIADYQ